MSLSEKLGVKKSNLIGLIIVAAAVIYGLVDVILNIVRANFSLHAVTVAVFVIYALIIYFAIWGYKVPNGKMLKYVYLLFALRLAISAGSSALLGSNIRFILYICAAIISAFVAGRLPRIKENKYNCAVLLALLLVVGILSTVKTGLLNLYAFIQGLALVFAYFSRAAQYKENSGILDDK